MIKTLDGSSISDSDQRWDMTEVIDKSIFIKLQQEELNGAALYKRVAEMTKDPGEKVALLRISSEEYEHAKAFGKYSGVPLKPNIVMVGMNVLVAKVLGYTFVIKMLERNEYRCIKAYSGKLELIPELEMILKDEEEQEKTLLSILKEERLQYIGDIVLGMNDALVELTGSLAGYTLAMQNTRIIAMAGLITGVSATLSIAASEYLSSREAGGSNAFKQAIYTGAAYLLTVSMLIAPYLVFPNNWYIFALIATVLIALGIIAGFSFYSSVVKGRPFKKNLLTMAGISLGVASVSFFIGLFVKKALGIEI